MKTPLHHFPDKPAGRSTLRRSDALTLRRSERGVALVITLILLAVITFMAIAFLVISRGERSSVGTATQQTVASQAANAGLERFLAEAVAHITISTNEFNYDLMVPTNYVNPNGFYPGLASPTNVNYSFKFGGSTNYNATEWEQNIANLLIDPRPPVFVTNRLRGGLDFRFFLDLNRNGLFEPTGWTFETNALGLPMLGTNQQPILHYLVGDPQWIGGLEFPDRRHAPDNLFLYRYTYAAIPIGKTLDINYIYNFAKTPDAAMTTAGGDGFFRNMGAGTYEINLASFLVDLNTNFWTPPGAAANPYRYFWDNINNSGAYRRPNRGYAFEDALSILAYRYSYNTGTLFSVNQLFGPSGANAFANDSVDGYCAGPPMMGTAWPEVAPFGDSFHVGFGWSGSPNANHAFSISDLFDKSKIRHNPVDGLATFPDRMIAASTNLSTYNRYTGYRLLSQLGTDSAPESGPNSTGTINLNYDNLDPIYRADLAPPQWVVSVTNFAPWTTNAISFFTNAAQRMLADAGYAVGPTPPLGGSSPTNILVANNANRFGLQIQIYPTNFYNASVHRVLQLAANIFDATTNKHYKLPPTANVGFPTIFRPYFRRDNFGRVFIAGYGEVTTIDMAGITPGLAPPMIDLERTNATGIPPFGQPFSRVDANEPMVAGIPLVVGAKKGFPNFNEFEMQTMMQVTRKLEFIKKTATGPVIQTNQMYLLSISNAFGVEAWNSYSNAYPRQLQMVIAGETTAFITNELGKLVGSNSVARPFSNDIPFGNFFTMLPNNWGGFDNVVNHRQYWKYSFRTPYYPQKNFGFFLTNSSFSTPLNCFVSPYQTNFDRGYFFPVPRWWLTLRTRLRFILVDIDANRIVDYVNLATKDDPIDITTALTENGQVGEPYHPSCLPGSMWSTNRGGTNLDLIVTRPTYGVLNQIEACLGTNTTGLVWNSANNAFPVGWDQQGAQNFFRTNLLHWAPLPGSFTGPLYLTNRFFAPYAASRPIYMYTSWQANDPLVHYTVGDLTPLVITNRYNVDYALPGTLDNLGGVDPVTLKLSDLGKTGMNPVNGRYQPWNFTAVQSSSPTINELQVKDPWVTCSDDWDFPTNKFPNVGWLGRVHRGTPWQTVYLKSPGIPLRDWATWSGNGKLATNWGQISPNLVAIYRTNLAPAFYTYADASLTAPTNDWRLLDIFSTAFNDNSGQGKLNINQTNLASWSAVLGGVIVLTNGPAGAAPQYSPMVIDPAGVYDLQNPNAPVPPMVRIVEGINRARAALTNQNQVFKHLGDLMSVPELTVASPFLNTAGAIDGVTPAAITDAAYERIPQQILGLLKCDHTPRFVVYAYGQALKPAEHSYVSSGPFVGLYTNYQVTAETAVRAVVRIDGTDKTPMQPHAVIESYNLLPPD